MTLPASRRVLPGALFLAIVACSPATEIVVSVDTDIANATRLELSLEADGVFQETRTYPFAEGPVVVSLPQDGANRLRIVARAFDDAGCLLAAQSGELGFVAGQRTPARLELLRDCAGVTCPERSACREGGCGPDTIQPAESVIETSLTRSAIEAPECIVVPGRDAGVVDAGADGGLDSGVDAGFDGGVDAIDASADAALVDGALVDGALLDAGLVDAALVDAGSIDAGFCGVPGREGSTCRGGTTCVAPLSCASEITTLPGGGGPTTYGNLFNPPIPSGTEDPANPGEYTPGGPSTVRVGFAPGGLCTGACTPGVDDGACGGCTTCSTGLGPAGSVPLLSTRSFTQVGSNATDFGVCRLNCVFEPGGRGVNCPSGYSCDPATNLCVEACADATQCNARFGNSASAFPFGIVEYQLDPPQYSCGVATGRCEWSGSGSTFGDECDSDADCAQDVGACIFGRCTTYQCNLADTNGNDAYPCPAGAVCAGLGANRAAICVAACTQPSDCFAEQACAPVPDPAPGGPQRACAGTCSADAECNTGHRCAFGAFGSGRPGLGVCRPFCDHLPDDGISVPGATTCAAGQACVEVEDAATPPAGLGWGECADRDGLCASDDACVDDQACFFDGLVMLGRCIDGCRNDGECPTPGERCVIQDDAAGNPREYGVCRAPNGLCAESGRFATGAMDPFQPLLGDEQCVPGQLCNAAIGATGSCVNP